MTGTAATGELGIVNWELRIENSELGGKGK